MPGSDDRKIVPRSILIFGAAAHIGRPLAKFLRREAPGIRLRLASTSEERSQDLRAEFPEADNVVANYFDQPSLDRAVEGMEGIFVITPGGTPEEPAMANLIGAIKKRGEATHILRCLGVQPEANLRRLPENMRTAPALNLPVQHALAKRLFDESDLPVTYLNFGGAFLDNLLWMTDALRRDRTLVWHDRLIPFIDPRDIAEVAGRLFLSPNHRHIGQFHTLNNGHDLMRYSEVAALMGQVFEEPIAYDGTREGFFAAYEHWGDRRLRIWTLFEHERENEVVWALNDCAERILKRKPVTLREWLREHRQQLLG